MNQAIKGKLGRYWHVLETVASSATSARAIASGSPATVGLFNVSDFAVATGSKADMGWCTAPVCF